MHFRLGAEGHGTVTEAKLVVAGLKAAAVLDCGETGASRTSHFSLLRSDDISCLLGEIGLENLMR